ncbi:MAG: hypothetical protein V4564_04130 [Pseudomonadota bacterium]
MMPINKMTMVATLSSTLLLTACNAPSGGGTANGTATAETSASGSTGGGTKPPGNWNATDACALLDKATVGAALGTQVTEAQLGMVHQADGSAAATSECTYTLAGGGNASFMARWSPIADNSDGAMNAAKNATAASIKAFSDKPVEDIAGLGKKAFFVPGINQLNVFIGEDKFVIITLASADNASAKGIAIALAKKIGA